MNPSNHWLSGTLLLATLFIFAPTLLPFQNTSAVTVSAGSSAQPIALPSAQQDFAVHVEATFSQNADQGIALISEPSSQSFSQFAVTIRAIGTIVQAAGPNGYPATGFPFTPGVPIQLIITGNVPQRRYSAWMALPGKSYEQIANNVGFRAGIQPSSLNTLMVWADAGTISVNLVSSACTAMASYNQTVLNDRPVAFWNINARSSTEPDLTGNGNGGTYEGGSPTVTTMPNGDQVAVFNGSTQYLNVPSKPSLSIPTTGSLTWEMWVQPRVLQFPNSSTDGYVDVMGKCADYAPTCEWESRMYNTSNPQGRCNRLSAYAFNPTAGLGSGADWQPVCGLLQAGEWIHVVGVYTVLSQPSDCPSAPAYPGSLDIWVNGVKWNQSVHSPTGCMSQYNVVPQVNNSPLNIGTMAGDTWFDGAIGKVAIYNYPLSQIQISNHYQAMTGRQPTGSCAVTCTF
jgi:hypothetical protein